MADVNTRVYRSPLRAEQAARTRAAVLEAARTLFLEQGYGATTVEQVAARAGVSKPTVFSSVGNKQTLLKTVRDVALAGDDDPVPVSERPGVARVAAAPTARDAAARVAELVTALVGRSAALDEVVRGAAAAGDPDLQDLWREAHEQRRRGAGLLVGLLQEKGPLRHEPGRTADLLCHFMSPDGYVRLVCEAGWTPQEYAAWLADLLAQQLLDLGES